MTESRPPSPSPSLAETRDLAATIDERRACGKAARKRVRRGTLGYWEEDERGHDALSTILAQNQIRDPWLVPIRHHRMAASPWNYYWGAAAIDAYIGKGPTFAAGIGQFARLYADQNERDHAQLTSAIAAGAIESLPG